MTPARRKRVRAIIAEAKRASEDLADANLIAKGYVIYGSQGVPRHEIPLAIARTVAINAYLLAKGVRADELHEATTDDDGLIHAPGRVVTIEVAAPRAARRN